MTTVVVIDRLHRASANKVLTSGALPLDVVVMDRLQRASTVFLVPTPRSSKDRHIPATLAPDFLLSQDVTGYTKRPKGYINTVIFIDTPERAYTYFPASNQDLIMWIKALQAACYPRPGSRSRPPSSHSSSVCATARTRCLLPAPQLMIPPPNRRLISGMADTRTRFLISASKDRLISDSGIF